MKGDVLIIEDEEDIIELMSHHLKREGFEVSSSLSGEDGLKKIQEKKPNLILLDLMLPGIDGIELCRILKQDPETRNIPIIMVSAKSEESDVVIGLELGADDYITKPFSPKVLVARVKSQLRRLQVKEPHKEDSVNFPGLHIIPSKFEVKIDGISVKLTHSEFQALHLMARYPGRVFTRYQIVENIHGYDRDVTDRSVDVLIVGLRKKMGRQADRIETIRGVGYRFKEDNAVVA